MTELVTAVFEERHRPTLPSKTLRRLEYLQSSFSERSAATETATPILGKIAGAWHNKRSRGWPSVTVAVDEIRTALVTGILHQHGPLGVEERVAQSHRR